MEGRVLVLVGVRHFCDWNNANSLTLHEDPLKSKLGAMLADQVVGGHVDLFREMIHWEHLWVSFLERQLSAHIPDQSTKRSGSLNNVIIQVICPLNS